MTAEDEDLDQMDDHPNHQVDLVGAVLQAARQRDNGIHRHFYEEEGDEQLHMEDEEEVDRLF